MRAVRRTLSLEVKDSLFDPDSPASESSKRVAEFRRGSTGTLYRVFIYLDGADLPFVEDVVYQLHHTFTPPERRVSRSVSNPRCKLVIWTWGFFTVHATVTTKKDVLSLTHELQYGREIEQPQTLFRAG